ncbi:MAG: LPS assembly lipoprotein LptE [Pseudomonadota bacterium]
MWWPKAIGPENTGPNHVRPGRLGRRGVLLSALLLGQTACGFQPMYRVPVSDRGAQGKTTAQALNQIEITPIANREGQVLRNYLVRDLNHNGRPTRPNYRLDVNLTETISRLAIQDDSSATRANLIIRARYSLVDNGTGDVTTRGATRVVTSFNILQDEFSTLSAERSARDRALRQTSLDIRSRLALALIRPDDPAKAANTG